MGKIFYKVYKIIAGHRILSSSGTLLLVAILLFTASKISFEEDITKLIPTNAKNENLERVLKSVNFADKLIVTIKREGQGSTDDLTEYASKFISEIDNSSDSYIKDIQGEIADDALMNTIDFVYENLPLFLNEEDYTTISRKIVKDSIEAITEANFKTLISPSGLIVKQTIRKDPLGLSFIGLKKLQGLGVGDQFELQDGFLMTKDKQHLLLFITPTHPSSETAENAVFADSLYSIQERLNSEFKNKAQSEYFGATLIAVANAQQIKKDIQFTVGIAITILMLIFVVFYRKLTIPLILFVPTVFGGLLSIAVLYLLRTQISAISLGIGSVLLGVTLDYSLHILTHIRNKSSLKRLYLEVTKPILMSSLTTALAFLCLLFLESQALQDLGIFAAVSVVGASVFALLFIPLVYQNPSEKKSGTTLIDRVAALNFHKSKWNVLLLAAVLFVSLFTYSKVTFNNDLSKLNYEPISMQEARQKLDALTNVASKSLYIAAYGSSVDEALSANDTIFRKLDALKMEGSVINFSSVGTLVHSEIGQQEKIHRWNKFWKEDTKQEVEENLIESGRHFGFKTETFSEFYSLLDTEFDPLSLEVYKRLEVISMDDFIASEEGFSTVTSLVKVENDEVERVRNAFAGQSQVIVIDRKQMNEAFLGNLKNDFNRLIGYSILVVLFILFLFYRSFSLTLVTSIPILLTWLLTIGVMGLFDIQFNIFNIIISTFIFGLGIDYSIFITNGLLTEYRTGEKVLNTHKTSIVLSVITTILGVGVLIFAKHPALYSISVVSIIGIISAVWLAFTIQPILFALFIGTRTKGPIMPRMFFHSVLSFAYFGLGGLLLSLFSVTLIPIIPVQKKIKMKWFHTVISRFMGSVLYTNPFVKKKVLNPFNESFNTPGIIIANHTSFLDILAIGMLHPKIIFLVNDWVYHSPIFGKAVQMAGFYPVSKGLETGVNHLREKVAQGYSLMAFPEGTRSTSNKIRRFHKGAFYLAEQFKLDIIPVLIHGNSEVLPKGTFVIKDGHITLKILKRIRFDDSSFGEGYKQRTKKISSFFKAEFEVFRNEKEISTYFHPLLREAYRYKGDLLYKKVVDDLKVNSETYSKILNLVGKRASVLHLSSDAGQLDFLLSMDGHDRKIHSYIEDTELSALVANQYLDQRSRNIFVISNFEQAKNLYTDTLIVSLSLQGDFSLKTYITDKVNTIVLIKEAQQNNASFVEELGFKNKWLDSGITLYIR